MNEDILKAAFQALDGEISKAPLSLEELNNIRRDLLARVMMVESIQIEQANRVAQSLRV